MYGVPAQLDLTAFIGTALTGISIGQYQIHFLFSSDVGGGDRGITVEGGWELRDVESALIDKACALDERDVYRIHRLLGRKMTAARVSPPESFTLVFDNGLALTICDDSSEYESCHIFSGTGEVHI
jgi:hypothetical protein